MEQLVTSLWPFFERAGLVAGVIMSVMYIIKHLQFEELREKHDALMVQQITEAKETIASNVLVIERNTVAMNNHSEMTKQQSELIRALVTARGSWQ